MANQDNAFISIIVPILNEEKNINEFYSRTLKTFEKLKLEYEIIFILDPCEDNSLNIIKDFALINKNIKILEFSRRFGQPVATLAGIDYAIGDYVVVIDVDLQDPPELIYDLYIKLKSKNLDVVYAKRKSRDGETFIKKIISEVGYKLINKMSDVNIPVNVGDFRIMSRRVVNEIKKFKDPEAFLRGIVSYVGFDQDYVEYDREKRFSGSTKYNKYLGSLKIGLNGLLGFTSKPLQLMSLVGFFFSFLSFIIGITYFVLKIFHFEITAGLPTTILIVTFFSGIQLMALGIVGEYIARIYDQVKERPRYIIKNKTNIQDDEKN